MQGWFGWYKIWDALLIVQHHHDTRSFASQGRGTCVPKLPQALSLTTCKDFKWRLSRGTCWCAAWAQSGFHSCGVAPQQHTLSAVSGRVHRIFHSSLWIMGIYHLCQHRPLGVSGTPSPFPPPEAGSVLSNPACILIVTRDCQKLYAWPAKFIWAVRLYLKNDGELLFAITVIAFHTAFLEDGSANSSGTILQAVCPVCGKIGGNQTGQDDESFSFY